MSHFITACEYESHIWKKYNIFFIQRDFIMITLLLTLIDTEDSKAYCLGHILALIICFIKLLHMHPDGFLWDESPVMAHEYYTSSNDVP